MQIRRLNPAENPRDAAAVQPALRQWRRDYMPDLPPGGEIRLRHWCTAGYTGEVVVFGVFADEQATEAYGMSVCGYSTKNNLDLTWADVNVTAEGRELGAETALFEALLRLNLELGRKRLAIGMPQTMVPAPFVEEYDGRLTDTAIMSTLDLDTIDRAQFEAWAEPSAKNEQYTLVGWTGRCPDELAESFCSAMDAMADQPLGEFEYTFDKYSVDRLRWNEAEIDRLGARRYVQAALDPDGNVAAFNMIGTYPDEPTSSEIWDTGVVRGHRGHGLGLRVKAAANLWLLEDRPSTRMIRTYNNNENHWMLAVNRTMGYRPRVDFPGYEFAVAG
ncbi:MAG TPA: hypothetical protein VL551_30820 [Actinospica sp.]|jgi:GNAT superfamily N-acetyltransferase|nr:hypothetical protein [Actinospica sp.]